MIDTGEPPIVLALRASISGASSASISFESPICISAWATRPFGMGIRISSFAPNAFP